MIGTLYYVIVYTRWLKRTSPQNIVIGGAAGAIPPLVGWAAVTNRIGVEAVLMFAIIFYWTPPHFWALALLRRTEYARAGIPMLPVVHGDAATKWLILLYTVVMLAVTLLLTPLGVAGPVYFVCAAVLGGIFLRDAYRVYRDTETTWAWRLYKYSLLYLALLFAALVLDHWVMQIV
jgi:protoheme IX farnesyltransferase